MPTSYTPKLQEPAPEKHPVVKEFMTQSITLQEHMNIFNAIDTLLKQDLTGAPVVNENQELVGFLSEKDCVKIIISYTYHQTIPGAEVSNYMTTQVDTITPDMGIAKVAELFMEKGYIKFPVVEDGKLLGVVRRQDIMKAIQKHVVRRDKTLNT